MNPTQRIVLVCVLAGASVLRAQAPTSPERPTFQLSVNSVDVDVTVTDARGSFVRDLSRQDFELFEDGKPQKIDAFSLVELPIERAARFEVLGRPVSTDVRTNADTTPGRVYVFLLDDLDVTPLRSTQVRKSARTFIEQHFGPHDIGAVVSTSGRKQIAQGFTSDPALLLAAVDQFVGQRLEDAEVGRIDAYYESQQLAGLNDTTTNGDPSQQTTVPNLITQIDSAFDRNELERGHRALGVIRTIQSLADFVGGVRGRRKALLFFSEGIDYPMAEVEGSHNGAEIMKATEDAMNAAALANVNVFAIDPRGLIGMPTDLMDGMPSAGPPDYAGADPTKLPGTPVTGTQALMDEIRLTQDSLRTVAEGTGGFAALDTNSVSDAFDRIVEANSRYYLLGYTPPSHPHDGRFHHIEVRVKRPGLKAMARRGYPSPSGKTPEERKLEEAGRRAREGLKGGATDTTSELRAALNSPVQQPGLSLTVQAVPFRSTPREASVALTVELNGSQLQFAQQPNSLFADALEVSFFPLNEEGKPQRGTRMALNLAVRPDTYERMKMLGLRINGRTSLAPGRYQLRMGARDPIGGKTGTVFYDVTVPDFTRNPLMMSGLLLSSSSAPQVLTAQHDPVAEKLLGAPPTSRREFAQNETLALMTEIYDNMPPQQPRQIDITAGLISEAGNEAFASHDSLANGASVQTPWTAFDYTAQIPLKDVAPGRYLLRVEAHDRGAANKGNPTAVETVVTITPAR
jgi:VWFA-related protein